MKVKAAVFRDGRFNVAQCLETGVASQGETRAEAMANLHEAVALFNQQESNMTLTLEVEREEDGRWVCEIAELPGVLAYGATEEDAVRAAEVLALRVLADKIERGEKAAGALTLTVMHESARSQNDVPTEWTDSFLSCLGKLDDDVTRPVPSQDRPEIEF